MSNPFSDEEEEEGELDSIRLSSEDGGDNSEQADPTGCLQLEEIECSEWTEYKSPNGVSYWYNATTGVSSWDNPNVKLTVNHGSLAALVVVTDDSFVGAEDPVLDYRVEAQSHDPEFTPTRSLLQKTKTLNPFADEDDEQDEESIVAQKSPNPFGENASLHSESATVKSSRFANLFSDSTREMSKTEPPVHRKQPALLFPAGGTSTSSYSSPEGVLSAPVLPTVPNHKKTGVAPLMYPITSSEKIISVPVAFPVRSTGPTLQQEGPEIPLSVRNKNIELGIQELEFRAKLRECLNDVDRAREMVKESVMAAFVTGNIAAAERLWHPPLQVRVSSWLPNVEDAISKDLHTGYFITVSFSICPRFSWQKVTRFTKIRELYDSIHRNLELAFPKGMISPFPNQDWLQTKVFGITDELRENRRKALDLWFREIMLCPTIIFDAKARVALFSFLDVSEHFEEMISSGHAVGEDPPSIDIASSGRRVSVASRRSSAVFVTDQQRNERGASTAGAARRASLF